MVGAFLSVITGYLIGSISPSYILGKVCKGIDIREEGEGNAGTINAFRVLGPVPAIITALFDVSKGLISAFLAHLFGVSYPYNLLIAYSAVIGHMFPFYLGFRGGQGEATSMGVLLYFLFRFSIIKPDFHMALLVFVFFLLVVLYITKFSRILGLFVLPVLTVFLIVHASLPEALVVVLFFLHIFGTSLYNRIRTGYRLSENTRTKIKWSRFIARPFAVLYIVIYFLTSRNFIIYLTGGVALFFFLFDIVRLSKSGINRAIMKTLQFAMKSGEEKTFSSMTHFTVSAFLSFLLFPREIACASILFPVFGDMFAKLMGLEYGRTKLFEKSLEGTLAYFAFGNVVGYVYSAVTGFPFSLILVGAAAGAISEALPWRLDDNLSGTLSSALTMFYVAKWFM
jgi:glycerol-3-phosphate acyltransferase PlsY